MMGMRDGREASRMGKRGLHGAEVRLAQAVEACASCACDGDVECRCLRIADDANVARVWRMCGVVGCDWRAGDIHALGDVVGDRLGGLGGGFASQALLTLFVSHWGLTLRRIC